MPLTAARLRPHVATLGMRGMLGPLVATLLAAACAEPRADATPAPSGTTANGGTAASNTSTGSHATPAAFDAAAWRPPADTEIPDDSLGASIRRGRALVQHTPDSLPEYAPGRIACTNCHLDGGRNFDSAPMAGAYARFPKYLARTGAVIGMADRVNYCFTRSLAGRRLPHESREMQDILAYLAFLSRGVPLGAGHRLPGADGLPRIPGTDTMTTPYPGDSARGAGVYAARCASCHGADGAGQEYPNGGRVPALWGARSYAVGASMARQERAATFIWHNMPLGQPRSLTPQQAYDVAAYVNAHPRPDSPGKADDWPTGGAPADVPYTLRSGHAAFRAPPVLPRSAAGTLVPPPAPLRR
jgi:thiosulfate dehydrogenase